MRTTSCLAASLGLPCILFYSPSLALMSETPEAAGCWFDELCLAGTSLLPDFIGELLADVPSRAPRFLISGVGVCYGLLLLS